MKCPNPECKNGKVAKIDLIHAKSVISPCTFCGGTGELPDKKDGLYLQRIPGMPFWMEWYEENRLVSWAKIRIVPVMDEKTKHMVIEVDHIETKENYRRKGIASELIRQMKAMFNGEVKFILTNWGDSNAASRALFVKNGFERDGKVLVWKKTVPVQSTMPS